MTLSDKLYKILIQGGSWKTILGGLWVTIQISALALLLGTLLGALICLLYFIVEISSLVLTNTYSVPLIREANQYFGNSYYVNFFDYMSWAFNNKPFTEAVLMFAPYFLLALFLVVRIVCGLRANRSYYHHCVKKVKSIKSVPLNAGEENHHKALSEAGGVNTAIAWMCLVCYVILYIASILIK